MPPPTGTTARTDDEICEALGEKFPKHPCPCPVVYGAGTLGHKQQRVPNRLGTACVHLIAEGDIGMHPGRRGDAEALGSIARNR